MNFVWGDIFSIDIIKTKSRIEHKVHKEWISGNKTFNNEYKESSNNNKNKIIKLKITEHPMYKVNWKYKNYQVLNKKEIKVKYYINEESDYLYIENEKQEFIENFIIEAERTEETITSKNFK